MMDISVFLARVLGIYLVILCVSLLVNHRRFAMLINDILENPALQFLLGLNILIFGIILINIHNIWVLSWEVLITILSWLILLKGILYLAFPKLLRQLAEPFIESKSMGYVAILINLLLGLILLFFGYR